LLKFQTDRHSYATVIQQALITAAQYQHRAAEAQSLQTFFEKLGMQKAR
jgi:hypothetical protein